jgi:hypothetical protein
MVAGPPHFQLTTRAPRPIGGSACCDVPRLGTHKNDAPVAMALSTGTTVRPNGASEIGTSVRFPSASGIPMMVMASRNAETRCPSAQPGCR